jgi:hypothetical protein
MCLGVIGGAPAARERPVSIGLPDSTNAAGIAQSQDVILQAVAAGEFVAGLGCKAVGHRGGADG